MGMRKVYNDAVATSRGMAVVHNGINRRIVVKMYGNNGPTRPLVLEPGEEAEVDAGLIPLLKGISPHLRVGPAPVEFEPAPDPIPPAKTAAEREEEAQAVRDDARPRGGRRRTVPIVITAPKSPDTQ